MTKARDLADFLGDNTSLGTINDAYDAGTLVPSSTNSSLIINGDMRIAQRGTTSTSDEYQTVDRFKTSNGGLDEAVTQEHHALTSSDTGVWELGFRHSYKQTNGNQSSGAGTDDRVTIQYPIEGQDMTTSGWDYTSPSSDVTLSFWCKSSVAQNFYARLQSYGGTQQNYVMETGSLTANTWTKITKTIQGGAAIAFDNDNNIGLLLEIIMFRGTNKTGTRALNIWEQYDTNIRVPDMDSTWYTTNDATFEVTGVKLEVGSEATDFQHTSYREELAKCQRYYETGRTSSTGYGAAGTGFFGCMVDYKTEKRAVATLTQSSQSYFQVYSNTIYLGSVGLSYTLNETNGFYHCGTHNNVNCKYVFTYTADAEL